MFRHALNETAKPVSLTIRRGGASHTIIVQPDDACDFHPTVLSDHLLVWDGGHITLERASDAMVAFAIAHTAALRINGPRRGIALSWWDLGEGIDFSLSMVSLAVGMATLGGWSAKPVDIFQGPSNDETRKSLERRLHNEADITADALALKMVHMAGYPVEDVIAAWADTVRGHDDAVLLKRLELLRIEAKNLLESGRSNAPTISRECDAKHRRDRLSGRPSKINSAHAGAAEKVREHDTARERLEILAEHSERATG